MCVDLKESGCEFGMGSDPTTYCLLERPWGLEESHSRLLKEPNGVITLVISHNGF